MVRTPKNIVAIVPARGGSKSIPKKNIKPLGGIPLIAYSIAAGLQSKTVARVIVSTDDEEIAQVAQKYGAEVPFMRPAELGRDEVVDLPVFVHAVEWLEKHEGSRPEIILQLRPTSPFRPPTCVDEAVQRLLSNDHADSVRGVTHSGQNPYKMWRIDDDRLTPLLDTDFPEPYNMPRQELPPTYWQTGHVEVIRRGTIIQKHSMTGDRILPYIIHPGYAIDLDTPQQWQFAEYLIEQGTLDIVRPETGIHPPVANIRLLVMDFDGVMTDNRVYVSQDGTESVACSREDGLGLSMLKHLGIPVVVLSTETNPVVSARCKKLELPCHQGVNDKAGAIDKIASDYGIDLEHIAYVGNDLNDLAPMKKAGLGIAVADAHPKVLHTARWVLSKKGGKGAVREICECIIAKKNKKQGEESWKGM